jgi:hypothetical protein
LKNAPTGVRIESSHRFVGWYVFYTKYKYNVIHVPFCDEFARRRFLAARIWNYTLITVFVILFVIAFRMKITSGESVMLFLCAMSVPGLLTWVTRPEKFIRISEINETSVEFEIESDQYATEFTRLNENGSA